MFQIADWRVLIADICSHPTHSHLLKPGAYHDFLVADTITSLIRNRGTKGGHSHANLCFGSYRCTVDAATGHSAAVARFRVFQDSCATDLHHKARGQLAMRFMPHWWYSHAPSAILSRQRIMGW